MTKKEKAMNKVLPQGALALRLHLNRVGRSESTIHNYELQAYFKASDSIGRTSHSDCLHIILPVMLRLAFCCGLRPSEVRQIQMDDIDTRAGTGICQASFRLTFDSC